MVRMLTEGLALRVVEPISWWNVGAVLAAIMNGGAPKEDDDAKDHVPNATATPCVLRRPGPGRGRYRKGRRLGSI